ncbi:MAG TPA: adenylate/guanylate cyclase domain-containing protein [Gemmataceae bacterium]|nr:adenylate/guanylate cyclase domain-containing protein [Gemmataceae bacterium]
MPSWQEATTMAEMDLDHFLGELDQCGVEIIALLQRSHAEEFRKHWQSDPRLARVFGKKLISAGQPAVAFDIVREGLLAHPDDPELLRLRALALANGRNIPKAEEYVYALLNDSTLEDKFQAQVLSLAGRLKKDRYRAARGPGRVLLARESARLYETAFGITGASYPSINAATMSLLAGARTEKVHELARAAVQQALIERQQPGAVEDYWLLATLGEAHLLLGDIAQSRTWYEQAVNSACGQIGVLATMRHQVQLLQERLPAAGGILELFAIGPVVAFVGHRIDRPEPGAQRHLGLRFPPDPRLEERLRQAIREELDRLNPTAGYCSGACGSDLLFAELMLERKKELHLVLPYARDDFYASSVDFGLAAMRDYRRRFDAVAERAHIHYGTDEGYLGDEGLLEFVSDFTQGLAILRAAELEVEALTLAVLDPVSPERRVGTRHFLETWEERGRRSQVIDLAALRTEVNPQVPAWWGTAEPAAQVRPGFVTREVKTMLFADVKNYSQLTDRQAPAFFGQFLGEVSQVIKEARRYPALCNTWGDGLFVVFHRVVDGADFALRLLDRITHMDFAKVGLPPDTTVRIGLHAGPVYPQWDLLIGRLNFFGTHVNRAARIEPKTPPGCVYASEQFAALLATAPDHDFVCEYAGVYLLGKEHDQFRCALYRLRRGEE